MSPIRRAIIGKAIKTEGISWLQGDREKEELLMSAVSLEAHKNALKLDGSY
jgi:hypothetical protein